MIKELVVKVWVGWCTLRQLLRMEVREGDAMVADELLNCLL